MYFKGLREVPESAIFDDLFAKVLLYINFPNKFCQIFKKAKSSWKIVFKKGWQVVIKILPFIPENQLFTEKLLLVLNTVHYLCSVHLTSRHTATESWGSYPEKNAKKKKCAGSS